MDTNLIFNKNFPNPNNLNVEEYNANFPSAEEINKIILDDNGQKDILKNNLLKGGTISYTDKDGNWVEETKDGIKLVRDKNWNKIED